MTMDIIGMLDDVVAAVAAAGVPATRDPAAPPQTGGPSVLVLEDEFDAADRTAGMCDVTGILVRFTVTVFAGGLDRGQVDAMRRAVPAVAAAIPADWLQVRWSPGEQRERPAYVIRIEREARL